MNCNCPAAASSAPHILAALLFILALGTSPVAQALDTDADVKAITDRELPSLVRYYEALHAAPELSRMEEKTSTDLAQELGVFGTPRQAAVLDEHRERLIAAARKHGKQAAMLVDTVEEAQRWIAGGVRIIAYSSDVAVLLSTYKTAMQRLRT